MELIIHGARQVGKTWLVDNVLAEQFEDYVKIDLEKRRNLHPLFAENLDPGAILRHLELTARGRTLVFFDEIQTCPRAIMALRYFFEEMPELHVVAAGSLLEFAFGEISVPVGRVQYLYMHPMTFYEYLLALGKKTVAGIYATITGNCCRVYPAGCSDGTAAVFFYRRNAGMRQDFS
jgi:predicted AAA+ superfamily ATPase